MICNNCGCQIPDSAQFCAACGATFNNPPRPQYQQPYQQQYQPPYQQHPYQQQYRQPMYGGQPTSVTTTVLAVAGFLSSIYGLLMFIIADVAILSFIVLFLVPTAGIVFSIVAISNAGGGRAAGKWKGFSIAGIAVGGVDLLLFILFLARIA